MALSLNVECMGGSYPNFVVGIAIDLDLWWFMQGVVLLQRVRTTDTERCSLLLLFGLHIRLWPILAACLSVGFRS